MDSIPVDLLKDTAGAGDWCTAGIIHMIGAMGAKGVHTLTLTEVRKAIRVGQAMASWACGFNGPRGGMYVSEKAGFQKSILSLLDGRTDSAAGTKKSAVGTSERQIFACESCQGDSSRGQR